MTYYLITNSDGTRYALSTLRSGWSTWQRSEEEALAKITNLTAEGHYSVPSPNEFRKKRIKNKQNILYYFNKHTNPELFI